MLRHLALIVLFVSLTASSCGGTSSSEIRTSGKGRTATEVEIDAPEGLALDASGNLYVSEFEGDRVVRISPSGLLTEVPTQRLSAPAGLAFDCKGDLFVADHHHDRILEIAPSGTVTTIVGRSAGLNDPIGITLDGDGNLYIADEQNSRVAEVDPRGDSLTTLAGTGSGDAGDGGPADSVQLSHPSYVLLDDAGELYVSDFMLNRVFMVDRSGLISTVAGTGSPGFNHDGGRAVAAELNFPTGIALDHDGNLYISDSDNNRVRRVDRAGTITTVAGTGVPGARGDGGPAVRAQLSAPAGLAVDAAGDLYIADQDNDLVRKVDSTGIITTVAGRRP